MQQYSTPSNQGNHQVALAFNGVNLNPVVRDGQIWMTSADLAKALNYSSTRSITNLFNANKSEFTSSMTLVTESMTSPETKGLTVKTRIFSLRGCHLIAMFARTNVAKDFRVWVLDILDREAGAPVVVSAPKVTTATDWQRYAQSMTIPEMAELTGYSEQQVIDALYQLMGSTKPTAVLTPELQQALDDFWRFVASIGLEHINHSKDPWVLAINIPEVYQLSDGQLPPTSLIYKALRLSHTPRFYRANAVVSSKFGKTPRRAWLFFKSLNQRAISN